MKLVREFIDFKRGQDPRQAMGIGKYTVGELLDVPVAVFDTRKPYYILVSGEIIDKEKNRIYIKFQNPEESVPSVRDTTIERYEKELEYVLSLPSPKKSFIKKYYDKLFKESIDFKRGQDPASAMGIGKYAVGNEIDIVLHHSSNHPLGGYYFVQKAEILRKEGNSLKLKFTRKDDFQTYEIYKTLEEIEDGFKNMERDEARKSEERSKRNRSNPWSWLK